MEQAVGQLSELDFLIKLQRILSEGAFVASYKFALLLALAELSIENSPADDGTLRIELDVLSERFIKLYWRQVAPFGGRVLIQATGSQAEIITRIAKFQADHGVTLSLAQSHLRWPTLVRQIGRLLDRQPLWRLQLVGKERLDFLYPETPGTNYILLRPGVTGRFKSHFRIVQALAQGAWASFVQRLPSNGPLLGPMANFEDFLFGCDRSALSKVGAGLLNIQRGNCFYCGERIRNGGQVDHFIPWAYYKVDLGHNLVLAHAVCNQDKSDMLAATGHLERWIRRNDNENPALAKIFEDARFPYDVDASLSVAEWAYENAERAQALVWVRCKSETSRLTNAWKECFK